MDKFIAFKCARCRGNYMLKKGAKHNEVGYAFAYEFTSDPEYPTSSTSIHYACMDCDRKENLSGNFSNKQKLPEEEGIAISVQDYKFLRFARSNPLCKALYKMFGDK